MTCTRRSPFLAVLLLLAGRGSPAAAAEGSPLENPGLRAARDGSIPGWTVELGAGLPDGPRSRIEPLDGGGVALEGDGATKAWSLLAQRVDVPAGSCVRLTFRVRATGLAPTSPWGPPYAGLAVPGATAGAAPPRLAIVPILTDGEVAGDEVVRAGADGVVVRLFLNRPGRLEVRDLRLERLGPADALGVLDRAIARSYAHFDPARPTWPDLLSAQRAAFPADGEPDAFVRAATALLAPLDDPHVWIRPRAAAPLVVPAPRPATANGELRVVRAALAQVRPLGKAAFVGEILDDVGYVNLHSLEGPEDPFVELHRVLDAWQAAGRRRLLLDLRWNGGGAEVRGLALAARFADRPRVYAKRRVRSGPGPLDLGEPTDARLVPAKGADPTLPVVVLTGPVCVSSGEGTALAFRVLPNVRLVGKPTRGASGNPQPVELPNGVDVWFSRWVTLLPDGTPLEHHGVPPHVEVEPAAPDAKAPSDPTFSKGLELLRGLPLR